MAINVLHHINLPVHIYSTVNGFWLHLITCDLSHLIFFKLVNMVYHLPETLNKFLWVRLDVHKLGLWMVQKIVAMKLNNGNVLHCHVITLLLGWWQTKHTCTYILHTHDSQRYRLSCSSIYLSCGKVRWSVVYSLTFHMYPTLITRPKE